MKLQRTSQEGLGSLVVGRRGRGLPRVLEDFSLVLGIAGHGEGLFQEGDRLVMGSQGCRTLGGTPERETGLCGQRIGLGSPWCIRVRCQIVTSQGAGQLVRPELLEETRRGKVARFPILLREGVVGDLPDERL